jgi:hypothetical protein
MKRRRSWDLKPKKNCQEQVEAGELDILNTIIHQKVDME